MRRIITVSVLALGLAAGLPQFSAIAAPATKPLTLAPNAPDRHVVVPGDTLWDISAKFLNEPFRWPELWRLNAEDIKNPHLIYPGQVLILERDADGKPRLRVAGGVVRDGKVEPKIYAEAHQKAIASIPFDVIRPYLVYPKVMDIGQLDAMPRVVAAMDDRELLAMGDVIYVIGITDRHMDWQIYRPGKELRDPDSGELLGYESTHIGSARLRTEGHPASLTVSSSKFEAQMMDRLEKSRDPEVITYMPRAPTFDVKGRILTMYGATEGVGGKHSVVSISRGAKDGIQVGHVLQLSTAGKMVTERFNNRRNDYITPDEPNGFVFLFQVFDRVSYGIVMSAERPILLGDVVTTP